MSARFADALQDWIAWCGLGFTIAALMILLATGTRARQRGEAAVGSLKTAAAMAGAALISVVAITDPDWSAIGRWWFDVWPPLAGATLSVLALLAMVWLLRFRALPPTPVLAPTPLASLTTARSKLDSRDVPWWDEYVDDPLRQAAGLE